MWRAGDVLSLVSSVVVRGAHIACLVIAYACLVLIACHIKMWLCALLMVVLLTYWWFPYGVFKSKVKQVRVRRVLRTKVTSVTMALFISCSYCPFYVNDAVPLFNMGHGTVTVTESVNQRDLIHVYTTQSVNQHCVCNFRCKAPNVKAGPIRGDFCQSCYGTIDEASSLRHFSPYPISWEVFVPCKGYKGEGPLTLVSANVTSCVKHFARIATIDARISDEGGVSCMFLQESRIPQSQITNLARRFEKKGWKLTAGPQPGTTKLKGGQVARYRQPTGGVAALSKPHCVTIPVSVPQSFSSIQSCCQVVWVSVGCFGFYVFNVYLPTGKGASADRNDLMDHIFSFAASLGNHPIVCCGDFQSPPESNASIVTSFIADEWFDVYAEQQQAQGLQIEHTFQKSNSVQSNQEFGKTRIDYFLLNRLALPLFQSASVVRGAGFPNHSPCTLTLNIEPFQTSILVVKPHPKWSLEPLPRKESEWEERLSTIKPILDEFMPSLIQHAESRDVEGLWTTACATVTSMLNAITQQSIPSTRGKIPTFRKAPLFKRDIPKRSSSCFTTALKLVHEIRCKAKAWKGDASSAWISQLYATISNASKVSARCGVHAIFNTMSPLQLQASCAFIEQELVNALDACDTSRKQQLIDQWKNKLKLSARGNKSRVHRWLKGERVGQPRFFRRDDNSITTDPNEMLDMISDHMESIYNYHAEQDVDRMESDFYEKYQAAIDNIAADASVPSIVHDDLFRLFQKKSSFKASGLDGWKVSELQQLPPSGWIPFALVMKLAEAKAHGQKRLSLLALLQFLRV